MTDMASRFDENFEKIQNFRLLDDVFFRAVMNGHPEALLLILKIILGKDDLEIVEFETQKDLKNLNGRSGIFDTWIKDSTGTIYNVEIEKDLDNASPYFIRFHKALLDSHSLKPGQDINNLPDTYVIYITENDYFKEGAPFYEGGIYINLKNGLTPIDDGNHFIYVNGSYDGNDDIGRLMHDFRETDPDKMNFKILADIVRYFKKTKEGYTEMSKIYDEIFNEGKNIGIEKGKFDAVKRLFNLGYSIEQVSEVYPEESKENLKKFQLEVLQPL